MLQQEGPPEDFVIATGRQESVRRFIELTAAQLGWGGIRWQGEGVQVKVAAGSFAGLQSPIGADPRWATRVDLLDIRLAPGARIDLPVDNAANGFLIVTAGALSAGDHAARMHQTVVLSPAPADAAGRSVLTLQSTEAGAHAVLLAGRPLREPVVPYGPFVGNSRQDIAAYAQAFQRGDMGSLEPSFSR